MKKIENGVLVDMTEDEALEHQDKIRMFEHERKDRIYAQLKSALEKTIDDTAGQKEYGSAIACASYATSSNVTWCAEAKEFVLWRDLCYEYAFDYLQQAQDGVIEDPNLDHFLNGMPSMVWPELPPEE